MSKIFYGLAYFSTFLAWIGATAIHIWTLFIAYHQSGIFTAVVSFIFVGLSEFYWLYQAWKVSGFDSPYVQWIIVFVFIYVAQYAFVFIGAFIEQREKKRLFHTADTSNVSNESYFYGFGGWLYFVAIGLLVACGQSVFYLVDTLFPLYANGQMQYISHQSPTLAFAVLFETLFNIYIVVTTIIAAYLCYRLKRAFKKTMIIFYSLNLVLSGVYFLIVSIVPEMDQNTLKEQTNNLIRAAMTVAVWVPYFLRSKRVNNTYTS